jgi:hypothetical protein
MRVSCQFTGGAEGVKASRAGWATTDKDLLDSGSDEEADEAHEDDGECHDAEVKKKRLRMVEDGEEPGDQTEGGERESEDRDPLTGFSCEAECSLKHHARHGSTCAMRR